MLCSFVNEIYDNDDSGEEGGRPNRQTLSWNIAGSWFGYASSNMAELGFRVVGQDQLAGGPSPDNSATVSCP